MTYNVLIGTLNLTHSLTRSAQLTCKVGQTLKFILLVTVFTKLNLHFRNGCCLAGMSVEHGGILVGWSSRHYQ